MSKHKCTDGLSMCAEHPKWTVRKYSPLSGLWFAVAPGEAVSSGPVFRSHPSAVIYATERARAERLAAVQSAEGQAAS